MKTKILFKNFQIHTVPLERIVFDQSDKSESYILLNDIDQKRWKIIFKVHQAIKITDMDYANLNFFKGGDFPDDCYIEGDGHPIFRKFIMEVEDSKWIAELKKPLRKNSESANYLGKARHFLIPCYDYVIDIIAWDLELVEAD